mmetsp:Transcript_11446/g.23931  ORF Transcript_11446/g.23931 Transcript_11446/m.23931 type:complete len:91 (-) Transcript_11446:65-337(-)
MSGLWILTASSGNSKFQLRLQVKCVDLTFPLPPLLCHRGSKELLPLLFYQAEAWALKTWDEPGCQGGNYCHGSANNARERMNLIKLSVFT